MQPIQPAKPELCTIGYEGAAQDRVLRTLLYYDVQTLLDIRELPLSRKPGLSKAALGLAARSYGIEYVHLPTFRRREGRSWREQESESHAR